MLKQRFQPTSFQPATDSSIEKLIRTLDEMASYYDAAQPVQPPSGKQAS